MIIKVDEEEFKFLIEIDMFYYKQCVRVKSIAYPKRHGTYYYNGETTGWFSNGKDMPCLPENIKAICRRILNNLSFT